MNVEKNLGIVTAYGSAIQGGYEGTLEEFYEMMGNLPQYASRAETAAGTADEDVQTVLDAKDAAETAAQNASDSASAATTAAENAADAQEAAEAAQQAAEDAAASITTDDTLSITGKAADAKKTGDEISQLKNDLDEISFSYPVGREELTGTVESGWTISTAGAIRTNTSGSTELIVYPVEKDITYYLTSEAYSTASNTPGVVFSLTNELVDRMVPEETVYIGNPSNIAVNETYTPNTDGYLIVLHYTSGARGSLSVSQDVFELTAVDSVARESANSNDEKINYIFANDYSLNLFDSENPNVFNGYPASASMTYVAANVARTVWVECLPNTVYIVRKLLGARFSVAYGSDAPGVNVSVENVITDNSADYIVFKTGATSKYIGVFIWASNADTITFDEMAASVKILMVNEPIFAPLNNRETLGNELVSDLSAMTPIGGATYSDGKWIIPENGGISISIPVTAGTTYFINPTVEDVVISDFSTNWTINPLVISLGDDSISIFANKDANWKVCLTPTTSGNASFTIQCQLKLALTITGLSIKPVENYADPVMNLNGLDVHAFRSNIAIGGGQNRAINGDGSQANVAIGLEAQRDIDTGYANTAVGYYAQRFLTNGRANSAFGNGAQQRITTGMYNNAVGTVCQGYITSGCWNNAFGNEAQRDLTSGHNNVAMGRRAQSYLTTGCMNVAIGSFSGFARIASGGTQGDHATKEASYQTLVGGETIQASPSNEPQDYATAFGYRSMANEKATALGPKAEALGVQSVAIGYGARAEADHEVVIGDDDSTVVIAGKRITFNQDGTVTWTSVT